MTIGKEVLLLRARIAEKKKSLEALKHKADSYIIILRDILDPYVEDFTELDIERAAVIMDEFRKIAGEAKDIKIQIARLEKELNG